MQVTKKELGKALKLAHAEHWEDGLPTVTAKLRLAVNSLLAQCNSSLQQSPEDLLTLIQKKRNVGVRQILQDNRITTEALAFAIRDALS